MTRADAWRVEYTHDRYMGHLTDAELDQRFIDLFAMGLEVSPDGRLSLFGDESRPHASLERQTHLQLEYALRKRDVPTPTTRPALLDTKIDLSVAAQRLIAANIKDGSLLRFGEPTFISQSFHEGAFRLRPASAFDDSSLGPARADNELQQVLKPNWKGRMLQVKDERTGHWIDVCAPSNLQFKYKIATDYWVLCLAHAAKARLFADFGKACLIIREPDEFVRRLSSANLQLGTAHLLKIGPVTYYDPLRARPGDIGTVFFKDVRYQYQREYRLAWLPTTPVTVLDPVFVNIGPLTDIAEVIEV